MAKNYLLIYSEQLAADIELLCQTIKAPSNTLFQIRKFTLIFDLLSRSRQKIRVFRVVP